MIQAEVEILWISSFLMVFFYRRFLPLDVFIYAFGAENDASSSNLPIPFAKTTRLSQILHLRQPRVFFISPVCDGLHPPWWISSDLSDLFRRKTGFITRCRRHRSC